jgi:16S rRNA (guanine(966)-N(2))-methyltransferase RsmD
MAKSDPQQSRGETTLRIVGGVHRGRRIFYSGDPATRPMKDRVREAVFNLVGPSIQGTHAIDLFAGTGAVALEALSRGSARATAIERRFDMVKLIEQNAADLGLSDRIRVVAGNTFLWARDLTEVTDDLGDHPWAVFCCPPYAFYQDKLDELVLLVERLLEHSPAGSAVIVEADDSFDFANLPNAERWDVRKYAPAQVGVLRV